MAQSVPAQYAPRREKPPSPRRAPNSQHNVVAEYVKRTTATAQAIALSLPESPADATPQKTRNSNPACARLIAYRCPCCAWLGQFQYRVQTANAATPTAATAESYSQPIPLLPALRPKSAANPCASPERNRSIHSERFHRPTASATGSMPGMCSTPGWLRSQRRQELNRPRSSTIIGYACRNHHAAFLCVRR